ncbi:unnamed protein product [Echinostoma caproni]|uniref:Discs, large (Drosophila) homolog-associated protein 2b n=1 Tax=Echinostoma caproni TaxID=27848 RepID=A0A183ATR3_9TREM|nr:unnamed protein product [Echinostoma caproni]
MSALLSASQRLVNGTYDKRDHFAQGDVGYTSLTHSLHESILEEPNEDSRTPCPSEHVPIRSQSVDKTSEPSDVIDGNYFLRVTDQVQSEIAILIDQTEADLESGPMDEEVAGLLRTAVGKAKLLVSEKFVQFRNLCQQNLDWLAAQQSGSSVKTDGPDLVTLVSDLDGFWAMVMLQVDDVRAQFAKVNELRINGWHLPQGNDDIGSKVKSNGVGPSGDGNTADGTKTPVSKSTTRKQNSGSKSTHPRDDSAARAKARERLAMAKREMRAKQMEAMANNTQGAHVTTGGEDLFILV